MRLEKSKTKTKPNLAEEQKMKNSGGVGSGCRLGSLVTHCARWGWGDSFLRTQQGVFKHHRFLPKCFSIRLPKFQETFFETQD